MQEPELDFQHVLEQWSPLISGPVKPIGMSAFGDIYFLRPDGTVHVLDVLEGAVRHVAESETAFGAYMNSQEWLDANLMPEVVWQLHRRGLVRSPGQVFGFAPHPAFVGKIAPETAMVLDAVVWHSICSQLVGPNANSQA
ncbi:MAG: hypothetical protein B7X60_08755 [Polynucleobacter sp. 39-45-136]|nr:MAG: hypothetical protein B7X60_08755 [Polynucleobacter sp. 39-45-136]